MPEPTTRPDEGAANAPAPLLPDPNICETRPVGNIRAFGECLTESRDKCPHIVSYGDRHLCYHPNWAAFVTPSSDQTANPAWEFS